MNEDIRLWKVCGAIRKATDGKKGMSYMMDEGYMAKLIEDNPSDYLSRLASAQKALRNQHHYRLTHKGVDVVCTSSHQIGISLYQFVCERRKGQLYVVDIEREHLSFGRDWVDVKSQTRKNQGGKGK